MSDTEPANKARNREIAENEARRVVISGIRISGWANSVSP